MSVPLDAYFQKFSNIA